VFVAIPFGRIIAKASSDKEEVLVADCDLNKMDETRQNLALPARSAASMLIRDCNSLRRLKE